MKRLPLVLAALLAPLAYAGDLKINACWPSSTTTACLLPIDKTSGGTGISSTATFPSSGVVVTEAASETLTNKDINSSTNTYRAATTGTSGAITLKLPTITIKTSGTGTYTTPAGVLYLRVVAIGGGAGGAGSGTADGTAATDGSDTWFNPSNADGYLVGGKGLHGTRGGSGGAGGSATVSGPTLVQSFNGQQGGIGFGNASSGVSVPGGTGGSAPFSGGGGVSGAVAASNSGGGGGGAQTGPTNSSQSGSGGGAGAYAEAIISSPVASYFYQVGGNGSGGGAGTSGNAGAAGATGVIIIYEYYY